MDFHRISKDTARQVDAAIGRTLSSNLSPAEKQRRISRVLRAVGTHYYNHMFGMVSYLFGSEAIATAGLAGHNSKEERLANKLVRNYALSRPISTLVQEYYDTVLGYAQHEAFRNANSMQMHPVLTRSIVAETCRWCIDMANGSPYTNPTSEHFSRHDECDCLLEVSGFRTRNGIVKNYTKRRV